MRYCCWLLLFTLATAGWAVDIHFTVKTPGTASLGVYDAQGRLVRTLLSGKKMAVGPQTAAWDGKDDLGKPLPPGAYTFHGLTAAIGWQYLLAMGNAGKPPYLSSDGKGGWGGVWGHVLDTAVASDGRDVFLLWAQEEGTPALLRVNPHGGTGKFIVWGAHNSWSWGTCRVLAYDGKYVYIANNLVADDTVAKGKKLTRALIWRVDAETGDYANTYSGPQGMMRVSEVPGEEQNIVGLAADGKHLYASLRTENLLVILDAKSGERLKEIPVTQPGGLAMTPDGNLYALTEKQLVKFSPDGVLLSTVITGLDDPYDLCVDGKGQIYISDHGASMQVKVFTPDGKFVRAIGKAGGRGVSGNWAKLRTDLMNPTGPAVAADGTLYVGEDESPKRVCLFTGGTLSDEWLGPLACGCNHMEIADEAQPELVYQTYAPLEAIVRYRVDYAKKTQVVEDVWGLSHPAQACPVFHLGDGGGGYIRHFQGHTFLYRNNMPLSIFRVEGDALIPAARIDLSVSGELAQVSDAWPTRPSKPVVLPSGFKLLPNTVHDTNGDGNIDENEVDWSVPPGFKTDMSMLANYQPYVAPDLTVYAWSWKLPCLGLDAQGNPIYSWAKAERLPSRPMGQMGDPQTAWWLNTSAAKVGYDDAGDIAPGKPAGREISTWVDPDDGSYYFTADIEGKGKGIGWASSGIFARIGKMRKDGTWLWEAGDKATGFVKPGQFYKPGCYTGIVKGCICLTDWNGQMRIFDKATGLYVGSLFTDGYKGAAPDENLISVEFTEGHIFTHPKTGLVYALAGDGEAVKLYHVTGLEGITRFQGPVQLPVGAGVTPTTEAPEPTAHGWDVAEMPEVAQENFTRVFFRDADHGWILHAGGKGGPMYTVDGGKAWKVSTFVVDEQDTPEGVEPLPSPCEKFEQHAVWFIDAKTGWLGGTLSGSGFMAKTTDGGVTWKQLPLPANTTVKKFWFADATQGWMAPFWGEPVLRRTDDGGQSWRVIDLKPALTGFAKDPKNWPHRDFYAFDAKHLVVVGGEGLVLRTTDSGDTWQVSRALPDGQELMAVAFADATHGIAVGADGCTAATKDGGVTWITASGGVPNALIGAAMTSPTEGWAVGMGIYKGSPSFAVPGCLLHTADGGKSWKNVSPVTTSLRSIFFSDTKHGWAVGGAGGSASEPARMILKYSG